MGWMRERGRRGGKEKGKRKERVGWGGVMDIVIIQERTDSYCMCFHKGV